MGVWVTKGAQLNLAGCSVEVRVEEGEPDSKAVMAGVFCDNGGSCTAKECMLSVSPRGLRLPSTCTCALVNPGDTGPSSAQLVSLSSVHTDSMRSGIICPAMSGVVQCLDNHGVCHLVQKAFAAWPSCPALGACYGAASMALHICT